MTDLPVRFEERIRALLGEEYLALAAGYDKERVQGLRFNSFKFPDGRGDAAGSGKDGRDKRTQEDAGVVEVVERVKQEAGFTLERIPWVKEGYYYSGDNRPGEYPHHEAGLYYTQEPNTTVVVELLDFGPGERALDLCATPGGRSSHIASRMKGTGFFLSNEVHPAKAGILSQNMEWMGVRNTVVSNEDAQSLAGIFGRLFYKIVVNVPCLGERMFCKDEETRSQWSKEYVRTYTARQGEMLDYAAATLVPGGRVVYSICTSAPEESEGTVPIFLKRHPEFRVEQMPAYPGFTKGKPQQAGPGAEGWDLKRTLRIMPRILEGEGHFVVILRKEGNPENMAETGRRDRLYLDSRKRKEAFRNYEPFIRGTLAESGIFLERKKYVLFGKQLYLMPADMPGMEGLKVLRPGLHLNTPKRNRFEPSHALALALRGEGTQRSWELLPFGDSAIQYLKGEALSEEAGIFRGRPKGWVLVCIDGFGPGWAKYAGGMLKNHYPKGLRRN